MGGTIWLLSESTLEQGDAWDHSALLAVLDELDALCQSLKVRTISSFAGLPESVGNLSWKSHRRRATWFDPVDAIETFATLRAHIAENPGAVSIPEHIFAGCDFRQVLLEELDDCLAKVKTFAATADPFHLCVVS